MRCICGFPWSDLVELGRKQEWFIWWRHSVVSYVNRNIQVAQRRCSASANTCSCISNWLDDAITDMPRGLVSNSNRIVTRAGLSRRHLEASPVAVTVTALSNDDHLNRIPANGTQSNGVQWSSEGELEGGTCKGGCLFWKLETGG